MRDSSTKKIAGVNSRFASVSELKILGIQDHAEAEIAKEAMKFGPEVFKGYKRLTDVRLSNSFWICP